MGENDYTEADWMEPDDYGHLADEDFDDEIENEKIIKKKCIKHIFKEGSRKHVIYWDTRGRHCKEKDCEVNKDEYERNNR